MGIWDDLLSDFMFKDRMSDSGSVVTARDESNMTVEAKVEELRKRVKLDKMQKQASILRGKEYEFAGTSDDGDIYSMRPGVTDMSGQSHEEVLVIYSPNGSVSMRPAMVGGLSAVEISHGETLEEMMKSLGYEEKTEADEDFELQDLMFDEAIGEASTKTASAEDLTVELPADDEMLAQIAAYIKTIVSIRNGGIDAAAIVFQLKDEFPEDFIRNNVAEINEMIDESKKSFQRDMGVMMPMPPGKIDPWGETEDNKLFPLITPNLKS